MGYNTDFFGVLEFVKSITETQKATLEKMLGEDCRDHKEWGEPELTYIDLEFEEDSKHNLIGLRWNGSEKTYDLVEKVNLLLRVMHETWPDFGLKGSLEARGEEYGDSWLLEIGDDGLAYRVEMVTMKTSMECPYCHKKFEVTGGV